MCLFFFVYVLPYHSIFLHTHFGKSGKCRLKKTQTATTSSISCRQHGPIWPKLERHVHVVPTCRDTSATFPAKGTQGGLFCRLAYFLCSSPMVLCGHFTYYRTNSHTFRLIPYQLYYSVFFGMTACALATSAPTICHHTTRRPLSLNHSTHRRYKINPNGEQGTSVAQLLQKRQTLVYWC